MRPSNGRWGSGRTILASTWASTLGRVSVYMCMSKYSKEYRVLPREHSTWPSSAPKERSSGRGSRKARPSIRAFWSSAAKKKSFSGIEGDGGRIVVVVGPNALCAVSSTLFALRYCSTRPLGRMAGDYQHLSDLYSQSLFSFSTNSPLSLSDPYTYTSPTYDDQQQQPQHRPHPERYSSPPFLAPPSSSPPPRENKPSESYLAFSLIPSTTLPSPTRKLLVLDLNGTLLLRNPRPPRSARGHYHPHPAPRRVMPRPYLPALRSYFFAPPTRAWLDVMVWSSAQPHSVDDMILHTFGNDRAELIAVWARDTLGLAKDHYRAFLLPFPKSIFIFQMIEIFSSSV